MKQLFFLVYWLVTLYLQAQSTGRLALVTPAGWEEVATYIQAHKAAVGIPTVVVPLSAISTWPDAEDIREAIRQEHGLAPLSHVWLLGDEWHIPPFLGLQQTIHDFGYSLSDDSDYVPDWAVGRLPANSAPAAMQWLQQQQQYRQLPSQGATTALVSASTLHFDNDQGLQVTDSLLAYGLPTTLLQQSAGTNNGDQLLTKLSEGLQWLVYFGHGDAVGFNSLQPGVQADDIAQLFLPVPTVVSSAACNVADFTLQSGTSMGEAFITQGGIGFVGCTGPCHYDYSDTIAKHLLFAYLQQPTYTLGEAYLAAQLQLISSFPDNYLQLTELTLQQFVLLGDPTALPPVHQSAMVQFDSTATDYLWSWPKGEYIHIGIRTDGSEHGFYTDAGSFALERQLVKPATSVTLMGRHVPYSTYQLTASSPVALLSPNPVRVGEKLYWSGAPRFTYLFTNPAGQSWQGVSTDGSIELPVLSFGVYTFQIKEEATARQYAGQIVITTP